MISSIRSIKNYWTNLNLGFIMSYAHNTNSFSLSNEFNKYMNYTTSTVCLKEIKHGIFENFEYCMTFFSQAPFCESSAALRFGLLNNDLCDLPIRVDLLILQGENAMVLLSEI